MRIHPLFAALSAVVVVAVSVTAQSSDGFKFRSGVELVNTGCWVEDPVSISPGTCVLVPDDGPPRLQSVQ